MEIVGTNEYEEKKKSKKIMTIIIINYKYSFICNNLLFKV